MEVSTVEHISSPIGETSESGAFRKLTYFFHQLSYHKHLISTSFATTKVSLLISH